MSFLDKLYGGTTEVQPEKRGLVEDTISHFAQGANKYVALPIAGLTEMAGKATGIKPLETIGRNVGDNAEAFIAEQQQIDPSQKFTDIQSAGDAVRWGREQITEFVPQLVTSAVAGGAGVLAGRGLAAARGIADGAKVAQLATRGAQVANTANSVGMEAATIYRDQADGKKDLGRAALYGTAAGILDSAVPNWLMQKTGVVKLLPGAGKLQGPASTAGMTAGQRLKDVGKTALTAIPAEASQEGAQTILENIGANKQVYSDEVMKQGGDFAAFMKVAGKNGISSAIRPEAWNDIVESMAAGGLIGGVVGGSVAGGGHIADAYSGNQAAPAAPVAGGDPAAPAPVAPPAGPAAGPALPGAPVTPVNVGDLNRAATVLSDNIPEFAAPVPVAPPAGALSNALAAGGITAGPQPVAGLPAVQGVANVESNVPALQNQAELAGVGIPVPQVQGPLLRSGSDLRQSEGLITQGQGSRVQGQGSVIDAEFEDVTKPEQAQIGYKPGPEVLRQGQGARGKGQVNPQVVALQNEKQKLLKAPASRGIAGEVYSPTVTARIKDINAELQRLESQPVQQVPAPAPSKQAVNEAPLDTNFDGYSVEEVGKAGVKRYKKETKEGLHSVSVAPDGTVKADSISNTYDTIDADGDPLTVTIKRDKINNRYEAVLTFVNGAKSTNKINPDLTDEQHAQFYAGEGETVVKRKTAAIVSPTPVAVKPTEVKNESRPSRDNRLKAAHEKFKAKQAEKNLLKVSAQRFGNAFAIVRAKRIAVETRRAEHIARVATATAAVHTTLVNNAEIGKIAALLKGKNDLEGFTKQVEPLIAKHIQALVDAAETPQEMLVYSGLLVDGKPVLPKTFYDSLRKESGKVYEQANKADAAAKKGKERSTGDSLKRWFDKQRKDLDSLVDAANMEKSWKQLQKLTVRAEHFPLLLAEDATPGAKAWLEKFRSNLAPWGEYFTQVAIKSSPDGRRRSSLTPESVFKGIWTSYEGRFAEVLKEKQEKSTPVEYALFSRSGYRHPGSVFATKEEGQKVIDLGGALDGDTLRPVYSEDSKKLTHAERLEAAKDIAREYQDALKNLASKFEGAKDLDDIERIATDLFGKLSSNSRWERENQFTDSAEYKSNTLLYKDGKFELSRLMPTENDKYSAWEVFRRTESDEKNTTKRDSLIRPRLDKIVRTGLADKRGGKDISAEQLKKTFGFADITIGQYVTAEQAQTHINYSYDAMMTLADLLHAKPADLSFGGRLHYAIGALGSGKYAAHFQNEQPHPKGGTVPVINVTNTRGDGAFLHEFFHAIDFMTTDARTRQVISSIKTLLKEKARGPERVLEKVKSFIVGGAYYPHLGKRSTPKEHALYWLRNGYAHSYSIQKTDFFKAAEKLDAGRGSDLYWSNQYEPFARMAEAWGFDALKGESKRDDYLVADWCEDGKTTEPQYKGTPYPMGDERGQLVKLFGEFITALEWGATGPQLKQDHPWQQDLPDKAAGQAFETARKDAIEKIDDIITNLKLQKEEEQAERERKKQEALWGVTDTGETSTVVDDAIEAGFPAEEVSGLSLDELDAIFEQVADSLDASQQEDPQAVAPGEKLQELQAEIAETEKPTKDTILKAVADNKAKKQQQDLQDQTAADLAKEFAKQGVTGIDEALKGLVALFGAGPNKLQSFPAGFDEDAYKQAKPHFEAAAKAFNAAGLSFKEFVAKFFHTIIQTFGRGVKPYALQFAKEYEETYNQLQQEAGPTKEQKTAEVTQDNAPAMQLALWTKDQLEAGKEISWQELFKKADEFHGGTQAQGVYSVKDAYDAVESGVNQYLLDWSIYAPNAEESAKVEHAKFVMKSLVDDILKYVPTQTKRTAEMDEFQQFSTPPHFSYLANWVANLNSNDVYLEPSAGIGGLATFAKLSGVKEVIVNELSARRLSMLKMLPFDRFFSENAEQLNNILPDDVQPTVIVMNPPFSSTAGRAQGSRDTMNGAKHIEQALARLQPGGRLVAIVGEGMGHDKPAFRDWWKKIEQNYRVRANIGIDGSSYSKYGTTFDNQLLVIDKTGQTELNGVVTGKVKHPSEALALLEGIRNDRPTAATTGSDSNLASQSGSGATVQSGVSTTDSLADSGAAGSGGMVSGGSSTSVQSGAGTSTTRTGATDGAGKPGSSLPDTAEHGRPGNKPGVPGSTAITSSKTKDSTINDNLDSGLVSEVALAEAQASEQGEINNSQFEQYTPKKVRIEGAVAHNTPLVESAALAAVTPPDPTYTPNLPKDVIKKGLLSDAQLEAVVYAGQAHEQFLANGQRRGFFLGDGTGVGKGRQISGIIMDNLRQGQKKAVWISKKKELIVDAQRDFADIGGDVKLIVGQAKYKAGDKIQLENGILFSGYPTLRGQSKAARDAIKKDGKGAGKDDNKISYVRTQQIANWLGKDFDGVIVFDEAHEMGNAVAVKGKRGMTKPSDQALAALELQRALPKARILYVSATGATDVSNLAYAERLGLWGEGTPFQDVHAFVGNMNKSVSAMELVAQNLKQMGLYLARSLSFDGIVYNKVDHTLTEYQRETYDLLAGAWQNVLQNINSALEDTGVMTDGKSAGKEAGKIKSAIMSAFWGSHQRFFNQIITAGAMPSVLEQVEKDLADGKSVVLQLVNTNEADQERALAKMAGKKIEEGEEDSIEELDLTPREQLIQFIEKAFPVQQMEAYADGVSDSGKPIMRLRAVVDSNGKPVINKDALAKRNELVANIRGIRIPDAALQMLFNHFGADQVAEITGRGQRLLYDEKGKMKVEKRGPSAVLADSNAFTTGKKRILVFSQAGGTGFSFHADRRFKNQQQRVHYILQPGWSADKAIQGLGRSHRTNQSSTPIYRLVTTDIPAQKRFISSIARRLEQLGALTSGQRDTAGGSLFSAADNLESVYSRRAVQQFFRNAFGNTRRIGYDTLPADLLDQMGLQGIVDKDTNSIPDDAVPETTQFLNRLLSLRLDSQGLVFDLFLAELENQIEAAKSMGTFDDGMQTIRHVGAQVNQEDEVYRDEKTNAATKYLAIEYQTPNPIYEFDETNRFLDVKKKSNGGLAGWFVNNHSGRIAGIYKGTGTRTDSRTGRIEGTYGVWRTSGSSIESESKVGSLGDKWTRIEDVEEARKLWDKENEARPKTSSNKLNMVVGGILPIWDRFNNDAIKVVRIGTDDGRRFLGREIAAKDLAETMRKLNVESPAAKMKGAELATQIMAGNQVEMSNGWKFKRVKVSNDTRIEVTPRGFASFTTEQRMKDAGVIQERISFANRYFVPTGPQAGPAIDSLMKSFGMNAIDVGGVAEGVALFALADDSSMPIEERRAAWDNASEISQLTRETAASFMSMRDARFKAAGLQVQSYTEPDFADPQKVIVSSVISKDGRPMMVLSRKIYERIMQLDKIEKLVDENEKTGLSHLIYQIESDVAQDYFDKVWGYFTNEYKITTDLFEKYFGGMMLLGDEPESTYRYTDFSAFKNKPAVTDKYLVSTFVPALTEVNFNGIDRIPYYTEKAKVLGGRTTGNPQADRSGVSGQASTGERRDEALSNGRGNFSVHDRKTQLGSFSNSQSSASIAADDVQTWVSTLPIAGRVSVVQSADQLPASARSEISKAKVDPSRVQAMELRGTIYVIAGNIPTMQRAKALIIGHELAHAGQTEKITDLAVDWFKRTAGNPKFSEIHDGLKKVAAKYGLDLTDPQQHRKAVKEATAAIAENYAGGTPSGLLSRIWMYVKNWLRQNGLITHVSENDLAQAVAEMLRLGEKRLSTGPGGGINFALDAVKPFFSRMQQVVEQKMGGKMPVADLLRMLKSNNVTDAEIDTVLDDLRDQGGVATKQQVLDEIQANSVELKDVVLGEMDDSDVEAWWNDEGGANEETPYSDLTPAEQREAEQRYQDEVGDYQESATHFSRYTEPGGKEGSYREMFVTAPDLKPDGLNDYSAEKMDDGKWYATKNGKPIHAVGYNNITYAIDIINSQVKDVKWQDGHNEYSSIQNPVVRIRFNDREVDGKKILFIEEMQGPSDANQQKMPGYLVKRIYDIGVKRVLAYAKENGYDGVAWTTGEMQANRYDLSKQISKVVYERASGGVARIYEEQDYHDRGTLLAWDTDGKQVIKESINDSELPEYVGKDVAKKILETKPVPADRVTGGFGGNERTLTGLDLKVGGEGLKSLYDRTLPALFKKYGKEGVGEIGLGGYRIMFNDGAPGQREFADIPTAQRVANENGGGVVAPWLSVPYIPITASTPGSYAQFSLADQGIIDYAKSITAPGKVADMTRSLVELASQSIPERLKANIGKLLSNPWFGSEGKPIRREVVNMNLDRSKNRNAIISDLFQESDGYTGVEGLDAIMKGASKDEIKLFNDLIKYGDQNGVATTFTRDELYRGKTKFGKVPDRVVKAYKAFHEIMNAANRVRFEQLDQMALLPYADQEWYGDLLDLLNKNQERMAGLEGTESGEFYRLIRSLKRDLTDEQLTSGENPAKVKASKAVIAAYRDFWKQVDTVEKKHQGNMLSAFRDILGHRGEIAKLKNEWGNLKGYAPRNRKDGDWHVSVYTTNEDGERVKVYMKPTLTEAGARRHVSEVLADLPKFLKDNYAAGNGYEVEYERNQATPSELMAWKGSEIAVEALLNKAFDRAGINGKMSVEQWDGLKNEVFQQIAKDIMAQGFGRHGISRESQQIEGYDDTDYQTVLKEYIGGMAGWLSKMRFAVETTREAKKIGQADPMDKVWVNDYVQDAMKNSTYMDELAATARSVGAVYYLGFKVSSAVLNAFQNYTVGQAELSRVMKKAGINRSAVGLLAKAQKDVLKDFVERKQGKAGTLTDEEHDVLVRAVREGTAQAQNVRMMSGSQEMGFGSKWKKFTEAAMTPFQFVEQRLNREPGVLAAYRAFKKTEPGVFDDAAYAQAEEFINNTHYVMGRENLPEMVRKMGPIGKTAYLFQGYVHNYLLWLYNRAKQGEFEAIARSFGALAAMGGVFALPGADEMDRWIEKWFGISYKLKFKKFMNDQTRGSLPGEALNRFINYGLPSVAGVDFSRAVAVNVPFISDPDRSFGERVGGVWPGLLKKPGMAINAAQKGNYLRAVESLMPEFAANPMRAYRQYSRGATTVSGKPILDEEGRQVQYGVTDVAKKMMGFQPLDIAEKTQLKTHERAIKSFYTESRDDLLAKLRTAKDQAGRRDAMREIMSFNTELRKSQAWGLVPVISADSVRGALSYRPGKNDRKRQQWEQEQLK